MAIIFSIIRILFGVDLVQDTSKNPAAYLVQLFFYILSKFVADGSAFDNEYRSIADRTCNRAVDDAAKGRGIYDDIIVLHPQHFQHIFERIASQKLTGVGRYRSCKNNIEIVDVGSAACIIQFHLSAEIMGQSVFFTVCFITPPQYGFAQVCVNQDRLLAAFCKGQT